VRHPNVVVSSHMDQIVLLSWNVCGLNNRARRDVVRLAVDDSGASLVCLQETKLAVVNHSVILSMLGTQFSSFEYLPTGVEHEGWCSNHVQARCSRNALFR
jgi:hypothetical protein